MDFQVGDLLIDVTLKNNPRGIIVEVKRLTMKIKWFGIGRKDPMPVRKDGVIHFMDSGKLLYVRKKENA